MHRNLRAQLHLPDRKERRRRCPRASRCRRVFTEWRSATGLPAGNAPTSFTLTFPMSRPLTLSARFAPAASVNTTVSLRVDPQELKIIVDGTRFTPPLTVEWGWNSVHTVGADPVQTARGTDYAFDSWSDGGPINHEVRVPSPSGPIELVARFVPAHTSPLPDVTAESDGQSRWPGLEQLPGCLGARFDSRDFCAGYAERPARAPAPLCLLVEREACVVRVHSGRGRPGSDARRDVPALGPGDDCQHAVESTGSGGWNAVYDALSRRTRRRRDGDGRGRSSDFRRRAIASRLPRMVGHAGREPGHPVGG